MGSYTITDDLRPWVEATAPTMTRDGWREAEDVAVCTRHDAYVEDGGLSPEEAAALLAYRAEVADCLACFEGDVLVAACDGTPKPWGAAVGAAWEVLRGWRLLINGQPTDFGHEVARAFQELPDEAAAAKSAMVPAPDDDIAVASSPIPDGPPEHPEGGGAGAPSLSGDARAVATVGAVVCPNHGRVPLPQQSYDAQMGQPNAGWYCPECGERAEWDDDAYEEHLEAMRDAESASTQVRAIEAIRHANPRRVDMYAELLAQWKLEDDGPLLSLIERDDLDQVWAVLRAVAACPDLVAALNNVAQILALRETEGGGHG